MPNGPSVVTIGVFDGVHIGHQKIMRTVKSSAEAQNAQSVVITFDRNPEELVHPEASPRHITTLAQKLSLIEQLGIDLCLVLPINQEILNIPAEQFVSDTLHDKLSAVELVVGTNFAFGKGRKGTVDMLTCAGRQHGFAVTAIQPITVGCIPVSSTSIRGLLSAGKIEKATELLGHPFSLEGIVVPGKGLGRTLGYPTANIRPDEHQIIPPGGVYAVKVILDDKHWPGALNIGSNPTVGGTETTIEVYIIGFSGNIYEQQLDVEFCAQLRGEKRFPNIEVLKAQIGRDVDRAIQIVG